ncbi:MAG: hypothetical protein IKE55_11145 [Kiritimatiellae bacterium]|nr:hypothetical protein [Kiritimatiellia bacterium]
MKHRGKITGAVAATLAAATLIGFAAASCDEKKQVSQKSSEATVVTNDNGSVSRTFTESTVATNGSMVTEHRRETRTTLDADGNLLESSTSEYAQSYSVGDGGMAPLSASINGAKGGQSGPQEAVDSFMGLKFGDEFKGTNFVNDADEPTLLRATFKPKKALAGFDDYYVYVTPKTHKVAKVYACAKEAVDNGAGWRRNYLIEALEKRYQTWARPRSWCRPVYTFDIGGGRYVTACLTGASQSYETVVVAWDDSLLTTAADESEAIRAEARKKASERRSRWVKDTIDAF